MSCALSRTATRSCSLGRSDAIDMTLYKHPLYNFQTDLAPVVLVADQPTVLVARKDLPADGLKNFISYVKTNAKTIKLGSAGVGSTGGIDCELFNRLVGIGDIQEIPYRGSGPAMQDLIGGHFDYFCTISGSAAGPLQNKLVKGIAVFRHERLPSVPDVPTSFEQGVDFEGIDLVRVLRARGGAGGDHQEASRCKRRRDGNAFCAGAACGQWDLCGGTGETLDCLFAKHRRPGNRTQWRAAESRRDFHRVDRSEYERNNPDDERR